MYGFCSQQMKRTGKTHSRLVLSWLLLYLLDILHVPLGTAQELTYEADDVMDFTKGERPLMVPYSEDMNPSGSFTLDFLMRSIDKREDLQSKSSPVCSLHAPHFGYCVQVEAAEEKVTFLLGKGTGQGTSSVDAKYKSCQLRSCWVHITCIYDASSSTQMLFVDGALEAAVSTSFSPNSEKPFLLGDNYLGSLRNIRVYSGILIPQAPVSTEEIPPKLVGVAPPHDAVVEPLSLLTFEFSENVQRGEGRILLMREALSDQNSQQQVIVLEAGGTQDFTAHVAGRRLVITPKKPLGQSQQCVAVALEPGVVKNSEGTPFEGANYRVCIKDSTPPSLIKIEPASGTADLPQSTSFTLRFDEDVKIDIVRLDSVAVETQSEKTIPLEAEQPVTSPDWVILKPIQPFDFGKTYELRMSGLGGITDLHGNPFKGIQGHDVSIIAPPVTEVEDSEADEETDMTLWLLVGGGVAGAICLCGIMVRRLQKASAETRARYQVTVEPSTDKHEASKKVADGLQRESFRSKTAPSSKLHPAQGAAPKTPTAKRTDETSKPTQARSKTMPMPTDSDKFEASGNFDKSGTYNFSFTNKSTTANSSASRTGSKGTGPGGTKKSKTNPAALEADDPMERSCVDALEKSGVQVTEARNIGESLYRQMEERRNEPLNDRKKFFKDLLLKWHPDKNSSEFAKDVVRFLQAQKDWFLKE